MKYDLKLVMTCCDRLSYTQHTLESLAKCHGVSDINLDIFCEPNGVEVIEYVKKLNFCNINVHINPCRYGHTKNSHLSLKYGFDKYDEYVVLIEDDQLFAEDFLRLHMYFKYKYEHDSNVFSASAGHYININQKTIDEFDHVYTKFKWFSNQGWGTWPDRWEEFKDNWEVYETVSDGRYIKNYKHNGWDQKLNFVHRKDRHQVLPFLTRVKNIGEYGVHCYPKVWRDGIAVNSWAGIKHISLDTKYTYRNVCVDTGTSPTPPGHAGDRYV